MKRYFFFALFFPPAFMNLMLVQAHPVNVVRYFIAGYVVAVIPALAVALVDEALETRSLNDRGEYGAIAAFVAAPVPIWLMGHGSLWQSVQIGCFAAIVAFLCVMVFGKLTTPKKKMLMLPSPNQFRAAA